MKKKKVIRTNKVWTAVYFKRNIKGLRNSQLNFPTKSFFVSISLQAVIPTWKGAARSSCHSPWRTGSPVRRCHDPPIAPPLPPRSRQVYPPTSGWCQLHSLDLIAALFWLFGPPRIIAAVHADVELTNLRNPPGEVLQNKWLSRRHRCHLPPLAPFRGQSQQVWSVWEDFGAGRGQLFQRFPAWQMASL